MSDDVNQPVEGADDADRLGSAPRTSGGEYQGNRDAIRILHVDDDASSADLTARFLERVHDALDVVTETSVDAGLDTLAAEDVDCVVSDYDMPGQTGLDFLATVRELHDDLPFILFTGKGSEEIASEAIAAGVTDYLQKDVGTDQYTILANRIENAVAQYDAETLVERSFRAMDRSREGIALLDEDGEFIFVNDAYTAIVGYERDELLGEFWERVYPDEQVDRISDEILPTVPETGHWTGDTVYQRKDGSRIRVNHAIAYSEEGTMICLLRDLTDTEATRRALREERRRFDLFVDAVEDYAIFLLDPDGYITSWNAGAERIKGYTQDEILGAHFSTFYTSQQREEGLPEQLLDEARDRGAVEHRGPRVRKDGSTFHADVVITAIYDEDGTLRGFGKVTEDVTDAKMAERRRQENERYRQELYQITTDASRSDEEKLQQLLELGCERLDVENGHMVRIDRAGDRHEVVRAVGSDLVKTGDVTDLSRTFCRKTIVSDDMLAVHNAADDEWVDDPASRAWDIGCYVGGKVLIDDDLYGTVCFVDTEPRTEPFTHAEKVFVDLVARWLSHVLERREYTRELRVKERAMDAAPIGITLADAAGDDNPLVYANEAFERLTGYSTDEILGRNCRFLQGEETATEPVAGMRAAIDDTEPVSVELRNYRKDGSPFWNQVTIAPVRDDAGAVTHFVGFQEDATDRKQRERDLEESDRRFEAVFEDPNILVGLLDPDGTVLDVNRTAMAYLDADPADVRGDPFWETPWISGDEVVQAEVEQFVERAAAGEYVEFELDLTEAVGEDLVVKGAFRPVTNEDGAVVSLLVSGRDITEHKRREQALAQSEARYQSLTEDVLDTSEVGTFILDSDFEVVWVSEAVEEYFDIDRAKVVGADKATLIRERIADIFEDDERFAERVLRTYEDNSYTEEFDCHVLGDEHREERWLRHWSQPIGSGLYEGGRIEHYTDITERKKREQQLEAMDRVLRHNLTNQMNVIVGNADSIAEASTGEVGTHAEAIVESSRQLLDVTRKQRKIVELLSEVPDVTTLDVSRLVRTCVDELAEAYPDTEFSLAVPDGLRARAIPDLDRAIRELVENGIVHDDTTSPAVDIEVEVTDESVRIRVADRGPVIPMAERSILRGEGEGGPLYHGSGMGLWLVNWIVTYSDGTVEYARNEPRGNVVEIVVPKPRSDREHPPDPVDHQRAEIADTNDGGRDS